MSYVSVCLQCESNFTKRSMRDPKSYCDSCWSSRANRINRQNIYNRTKQEKVSSEEMRIRTIEEDVKEFKHILG